MPKKIKYKATKKRPEGVTRFRRRNTEPGKRVNQICPGHSLLSEEPRHRLRRPGGSASVNISMKERTGIFVDMVTRPAFAMLDSEKEVLKCLYQLQPIIAAVPGYKDNGRWSEKTGPWEVLRLLLNFIGKKTSEDGTICAVTNVNGKYAIALRKRIDLPDFCLTVPVSWLPNLEKAHPALFKLAFEMLLLIRKNVQIPMWEGVFQERMYEHIQEEIEYGNDGEGEEEKSKKEIAIRELEMYQSGIAAEWNYRLHGRPGELQSWIQSFKRFSNGSHLAAAFRKWFEAAEILMAHEMKFNDLISISEEMAREAEQYETVPLTPDQYSMICWTDNDTVFNEWQEDVEYHTNNEGAFPMYDHLLIKNAEGASHIDNHKASFGGAMLAWFKAGNYLSYKYRKTLEDPKLLKVVLQQKSK